MYGGNHETLPSMENPYYPWMAGIHEWDATDRPLLSLVAVPNFAERIAHTTTTYER